MLLQVIVCSSKKHNTRENIIHVEPLFSLKKTQYALRRKMRCNDVSMRRSRNLSRSTDISVVDILLVPN